MEKRYQVFISSTSKDLQDARQEVSQALLRSDCFPAQMEQWPATDEEQFDFIKQIIFQCDYYIVISAGMYGSIHPETGLSYTEMEFEYAQELGIPIIRLLHRDPFNTLTGANIESTTGAKRKLKAFQNKLKSGKMCAFWETPTELGREVILSLNDIKKRRPKEGWVRASQMSSTDALIEISDLRRELSELKLSQTRDFEPVDVAETLKSLTGSVSLTRYNINPTEDRVTPSSYNDDSINDGSRNYIKTSSITEFTANDFAHKLLYGLLFSREIDSIIRRGFASKEVDERGHPLFLMICFETRGLEDMFMTLENKGIIVAGEKLNNNYLFAIPSYVNSCRWYLTDVGRRWIVANKPK